MSKTTKTDSFKMPSVMSRKQHEKKRAMTLANAVLDYHEAGKRCPNEWIKELGDLNKTFSK